MAEAVVVVRSIKLLILWINLYPLSLRLLPKQIHPRPALLENPSHSNAFQSTHFKFQSSLNKPIITANITIIFSEEEAQIQPPTSTVAEHPQSGLRVVDSLGSGQTSADEDKVERRGDMHGEGGLPSASQPPGGLPNEVKVSVAFSGSSSGIRPESFPPDGSGVDDVECDGVFWYGNACPVIEEPLDQDVPM